MKRWIIAALTVGAAVVLTGAAISPAAVSPNGWLIGSAKPMSQAQVAQLKTAGANVTFVYRNFGGAAATMNASKAAEVAKLSFVTSVSEDTVKRSAASAARSTRPSTTSRRSSWPTPVGPS